MLDRLVDIHSHIGVMDKGIISHPTFSIMDDAIVNVDGKIWGGLHPWDSAMLKCDELLERFNVIEDKLIGVGEIGLDYSLIDYDKECQIRLFEYQLDYAISRDLPITVHCVKAYNDMVFILKKRDVKRVVIHSFIGHPTVAKQLIDTGCMLSFSSSVLKSKKSMDALRDVPSDRLFLETDAELGVNKGSIIEMYRVAAKIRGVEVEELVKQIYKNYLCLIG